MARLSILATKKFNREYDDYLRTRGLTHEQHVDEVRRQHEGVTTSSASASSQKSTGPVGASDPRVDQTIDILKQVIQLGRMAVTDPSGPYFTAARDQIDAEMAAYFLIWLNKDLRTRFEDNPNGEEVIGRIRTDIEADVPGAAEIIDERKTEFYMSFMQSGGARSLEEMAILPLRHLKEIPPAPSVASDVMQCTSALLNELTKIWEGGSTSAGSTKPTAAKQPSTQVPTEPQLLDVDDLEPIRQWFDEIKQTIEIVKSFALSAADSKALKQFNRIPTTRRVAETGVYFMWWAEKFVWERIEDATSRELAGEAVRSLISEQFPEMDLIGQQRYTELSGLNDDGAGALALANVPLRGMDGSIQGEGAATALAGYQSMMLQKLDAVWNPSNSRYRG